MPQLGGKPKKSSKETSKKTSKKSSDSKRHFTVVMEGKEHGLYVSSTPSSAAKKAVTKLCAANKSKKVQFSIREITQGSKKKTYGPYEGYIEKLKEPIKLKSYVIEHKPVAKLSVKKGVKKGGMRGGNKCDIHAPFLLDIGNGSPRFIELTNNLKLINILKEDYTIFKIKIQQLISFSAIKKLLFPTWIFGNFDDVRDILIYKTKEKYKNKKDCTVDQFGLTPESILFICIHNTATEILEQLKKISLRAENSASRNLMFREEGN
jgi:hypothetical protein